MARNKTGENGPVIIKKYANRRLYDTARSAYVTLDDLSAMVHDGVDFVVQDAKSGKDLTRQVLTQIIIEREAGEQPLLPVDFLRQLIGFYGGSMQSVVPDFLDMSMKALMQGKARYDEQMRGVYDNAPLGLFEEQMRRNLRMFEDTLSMFSPFAGRTDSARAETPPQQDAGPVEQADLDELRAQMAAMQAKLDKLGKTD